VRDHRGVFSAIDIPGASQAVANGINSKDQIVGQFVSSVDGSLQGFIAR
jgi:hypothetical protein